MGTVAHHQNRSRIFLSRCATEIDANRLDLAAESLRRAASHAVTAAAVHWHFRHHSKRRLNTVIYNLAIEGRLPYSCVLTFRNIYKLPRLIDNVPHHLAARTLRRHHRSVIRLVKALDTAMTRQPNPPTLEQAIAAAANDNASSQAQRANPQLTRVCNFYNVPSPLLGEG